MSDDKPAFATTQLRTWSGWELRLVALIAALFAAVAGGVLHAPAAAAHGGPYDLEVHNDGAGGVQVFANYVEDGHVVEAIMDPVVEAVSADGDEVGPVRLVSSAEGQGRWISDAPFLEAGDWTVTVTTTTPEEASVTAEFTVEPFDPPTEPTPAPAPSDAEPDGAEPSPAATSAASASGDDESTSVLTPATIIAGAAVIAILIAMLVIALRRRRETRGDA